MKSIDELIAEFCPDGVEYKPLGELGEFYGGLTGKCKDDFANGNAKFISYMNVYSNPATNLEVSGTVKVAESEKQNQIQYGDILFTGSSETQDECAMSSVVTADVVEPTYLNSFCFGLRLFDGTLYLPNFLKHLLRGEETRKQLYKTANGVTRFNVSKEKMARVTIPLPPLAVQKEIVRILDGFTGLIEELEAELAVRRKQYEQYRDKLLTFGDDVERKSLGSVAEIFRGGSLQKRDFVSSGIPCIHYGQIYTSFGVWTDKPLSYMASEKATNQKFAKSGDIIMAVTSETVEDVCKCVAWMGDSPIAISGHTAIIQHNQNPKYLSYYFHTSQFATLKRPLAHGVKVIEVTPEKLKSIVIPLPPLAEQKRIVEILDKFDALCNDETAGLTAEIAARKKQYEYYRDKLLTFKKAS